MDKIKVLLTPEWKNNKIESVAIKIVLVEPNLQQGSRIFQFHKDTVGVPFLSVSQRVQLLDEASLLEYTVVEKEIPKLKLEDYILNRSTLGDVQINYKVELKPVGKNPAFDLGYEDGGMNGSGMSFLPVFEDTEYEFFLDWDLTELPKGSRGIWSFGEGSVHTVQSGRVLAESFYYAGNIKGVTRENLGFYWFENPDLPGEEVGSFVITLFEKMAEFFEDTKEPYQVFSRKVPEVLTGRNKIGGLALTRSFLYLYPEENPPKEETLKFLFPHEMVHNWLKLEDEPFGTCTWYVEGTAEYYSMVLPDRFGMLKQDELVKQLNKRAKDYYENPRLQVTNQYAGEHLFIDKEATLIPYGRGFFYLLHMDECIRTKTDGKKSLDDVVLAIHSRVRAKEECGNEVWLEEVKKVAGLDASQEFEEMQKGKVFLPKVTSFTTPIRVLECKGIQRETGKECVLYQFEG